MTTWTRVLLSSDMPICMGTRYDLGAWEGVSVSVSEVESVPNDNLQGIWIPSEQFARYAEADLDRWRQIIGHRVQHVDSRWGAGLVEAVSWGSCCDHVPAYVQIKIRYEAGWTIIACSETWHHHHQAVSVPAIVQSVICKYLDSNLSQEERRECLAQHARELREQRDREMLDRAARMKQRVLEKRSADADSENVT